MGKEQQVRKNDERLGVKSYDAFLCCATNVVLFFIVLPSLFSLIYFSG